MSETVRIGIVLSSGGVRGVYAHTGFHITFYLGNGRAQGPWLCWTIRHTGGIAIYL
jgi:hypothetical protein